jgi:hypothetical protein
MHGQPNLKTHSEYLPLIDFPLQQWLNEQISMLHYTYTVCLVDDWHSILNRAENLIDCGSPWPHVSMHVLIQATYIWAFIENCDMMNINTSTAIKLGSCIVNILRQIYINYYIMYLILNVLFRLNTKTTLSRTCVYMKSSVFRCCKELTREVHPSLVTPCI